MIYLIVSILFMTGLALCLRAGAAAGGNAIGLSGVFRLVGGGLALVVFFATGQGHSISHLWQQTGWIAMLGGLFYFLSGYCAVKAVEHGHLGITWTITRCSVVIPTVASMVIWHEVPLWPINRVLVLRVAGLAMILLTVGLVGMDRQRRRDDDESRPVSGTWLAWLSCTFFAQGFWEVCLRSSRGLETEAARSFFIITVFVVAMVLSIALWLVRRPPLGRVEVLWGGLAGLCAFVGSGARPWALRDLKGVIVFPVTAVAVMLLVQGAGSILWKHHFGRWGKLALGSAAFAIILLTV